MATTAILNLFNPSKASTNKLQPFWSLISLLANLHVTRNIIVKFLEAWNKFNNFCTLITMATSAILNFINTTKASTHDGEIPTMFHEVWRKKSKKFVLPIPIFLAYLVSLDVEVTGNITVQICEVWSEFNIFYTLVTMATAAILNFFQPPLPRAATHYGGYSYKVSWSSIKWNPNKIISPFFVSMASVAKFVQPIPIFLACLVPPDVDVVPIKFHQFLFGE